MYLDRSLSLYIYVTKITYLKGLVIRIQPALTKSSHLHRTIFVDHRNMFFYSIWHTLVGARGSREPSHLRHCSHQTGTPVFYSGFSPHLHTFSQPTNFLLLCSTWLLEALYIVRSSCVLVDVLRAALIACFYCSI